VGETFNQENCSVAPCRASGLIISGASRIQPCTVRVADGELTIIHQGGKPLVRLPARAVEIASPGLRNVALVILRANGELLAVEFDFVYRRNKLLGSRQRGILRTVQAVFLASVITDIPAMRLGRQLAAEFTAALLADGAREKNAANA
jgi:hypothetical protein